ncbi:unnamed protein product [Lathyrus sativus]|nr:unnamed protein product [Lathyrus sativus]
MNCVVTVWTVISFTELSRPFHEQDCVGILDCLSYLMKVSSFIVGNDLLMRTVSSFVVHSRVDAAVRFVLLSFAAGNIFCNWCMVRNKFLTCWLRVMLSNSKAFSMVTMN